MEILPVKQLITQAKNICLIPSQINEPESLTATLALFYTLKELGKNVNLIVESFPSQLQFLIPTMDFISQPKNFVISIPKTIADISQVYYEKNDDHLKIHLTIEKGQIKKDDLSFYFADAKPDLIITLGIEDFRKALESKLDSFGFLLDAPIVNIDNNTLNTKFGKINIVEEKSISQMVMDLVSSAKTDGISKDTANCLLTGLTIYYENFQTAKTTGEIFQMCAMLMKQGASRQQIIDNLYKPKALGSPIKTTEEVVNLTS